MSKYAAQVVDDVVIQVIVTPTLSWVRENIGGEWIECKVDGSIRSCYPGPGFSYDRANDVFVAPLPPPEPDQP
jgi:hypothetical protein